MATQPTQDAVPSESPRDLKFNAGKIDEFVTSMGWTYTDRFGVKHYTIEGINYLSQQAMAAYGYVILTGKTFTTGATINNPNEVLLNTADGEYYKWTGSFASGPKVVPANSTPASTGGIAPGAWIGVGDSSLRAALAALSGAGLIGYDPAQTYGTKTVGAELKSQSSDIASLKSKLPDAITTLATVLKKVNDGTAITIACYGDSLTYGQDTTATGGRPPINGATQGRSPNPYPESLATSLSTVGITTTVYNRGYPGDTSADGLTRWSSVGASDVSIISYGTNDALNYGGTGLVSVDDFRKNISTMIERERAKGAVVILMSAPNVAERTNNAKVAPYRAQMKYLSEAYGLTFIDAPEQISTITNNTTDNVHLTTFAYCEWGWHIAALFTNRNGAITPVCAGQIYHPTDHIGYGGSTTFKTVTGAKGRNLLIELPAGSIYAIGVYCEEDVFPVIHSYNEQATNSLLSCYYAGAPGATSGAKIAAIAHQSSKGKRQKVTAQKLCKGLRTLYILNNGTVPSYIEAVEFVGVEEPASSLGYFQKSSALTGAFQPIRFSNLQNAWATVDVSRMLTSDCQFVARLTLGNENIGGIALFNGPQAHPDFFNQNALLVIRSGSVIGIREIIDGVVGSDTASGSGVFPATGTWTGEIEVEIIGTTCNVYVDGTLRVTKTGVTVNRGYAGLYGYASQRLACHGAWVKGYTKALYE